jgi:hypothetical protein
MEAAIAIHVDLRNTCCGWLAELDKLGRQRWEKE